MCWCGNSYGKNGALAESLCNAPCGGNQNQMCGGNVYANAIYQIISKSNVQKSK